MCLAEHDILDEMCDVDKNYNFLTDICITIFTGKIYYFENLVYNKVTNTYSGRTYKGEELSLRASWILVIEKVN